MASLRIIFMGTAELACASLSTLLDHPAFAVHAVVTQPDRPKGRDLKLQPSPVKMIATSRGVPVLQPERARHENFLQELKNLQPELIVVAAYGQILPASILELPAHGCLNVHTSLLPKYRGAAPIQWAIIEGELETGVTIMKMDAGLDTGDILAQAKTPIEGEDDAQTLHDRLAKLGAELLVQTIPDYVAGKISATPQPANGASYARKITREDGKLDWSQPATVLWNRVRGFTPWPGAYTFHAAGGKSRLIKISAVQPVASAKGAPGEILRADKQGVLVACGEGGLEIRSLQKEGGKRLSTQDFLSGYPLQTGERFG